jgi:glycosyltransferase involved in cell wall biosynthesis|tara:strand:- start:801 stop:1970 length:1170 start_codon:yes stop_codon:yes gene_type:complete
MTQELSSEMFKKGHNVIVCTTIVRKRLSYDEKNINIEHSMIENGIKVVRVESRYQFSSNFIIRGLYQILFPYIFWSKIKNELGKNIEVVIVYSPPLAWAVLGRNIKKKYNARYILNVQDIFPQNAIDLGIIKNKLLIKYFEHQEKNAYESADKLTSHTKNSRKFLISNKGIPPSKIKLITNWIDVGAYSNAPKTNYFKEKYGLVGKFIFLFAGVIGPSQGLDFLIHTAKQIKNKYPDICFLFVGDGLEKKKLMAMAKISKLDNVVFKPLVSIEEYPKLLNSADVGIVCLNNMNKTGVYPAKIFGYMASSLPVCAILHKESDGHDLVKESGCGISIFSDESKKVKKDLIIKMYKETNKLKEYGRHGLDYVKKYYSKDTCIELMNKVICAK